jgi:hypothetical protein
VKSAEKGFHFYSFIGEQVQALALDRLCPANATGHRVIFKAELGPTQAACHLVFNALLTRETSVVRVMNQVTLEPGFGSPCLFEPEWGIIVRRGE